MSSAKLDILVLLRETGDPRPPARAITRGAAISERGLRYIPNPADLAALEEALCLKDKVGASVTALAIGPERVEDTLRLAVAMGADRVIRFWDHGMDGGDSASDAGVVARIVSILAPTLVFTGTRLADRGDDLVPSLAAARAGLPCISAAVSLQAKKDGIEVLRKGDRGARQSVTAPYPCTVLFEEERTPRYPDVQSIIVAMESLIEHWGLPDLGLPFWEVGASGAYLPSARIGSPRPDPVRTVTPDASLPAFDRILSLLSGGIKARAGKVHQVSPSDTADYLWQILCEEGLVPEGAR